MKTNIITSTLLIVAIAIAGCGDTTPQKETEMTETEAPVEAINEKGTYGYDLDFLQKHEEVINLTSKDGKCQVAVIADYQGRVMTSTSNGPSGKSYGWINYDLIKSGEIEEKINVFGGEDRFWLGPEGGQYSIFFKKGTEFTAEFWNTPAAIDTEPFKLLKNNERSATFERKISLTNYSDFEFKLKIKRKINIFGKKKIEEALNISLNKNIQFVGYQSKNTMKNIGSEAWSKETGLLSIWIMGMLIPSENTTVIAPYKGDLELNTKYFGEINADRLTITDDVVLFKADGKYRCKIGVPPKNALPIAGSYDSKNNVLTIIQYTFNGEEDYVNSLWKHQDDPYAGDVMNSYNDGPFEDGTQLGPFYELESSSSAKALQPDESIEHIHKTFHFEGTPEELNAISKAVLNFDLEEIVFAE